MARLVLVICCVFCLNAVLAQPYKTIKKYTPYKWMIGVSWVAIDDNGHKFERMFDVGSSWNILPYPNKLSVDRYFKKGWSAEISGTYAILKSNRYVNDTMGISSDLINIDLTGKYSFYTWYAPRHRWIEPYFTFGIGYTYRTNANTDQHAPTVNAGFGLNFWVVKNIGVQLHSTGKLAVYPAFWDTHGNYFQHSAGIVYRFKTGRKNDNGNFGNQKHKWAHGNKRFKKKGGH